MFAKKPQTVLRMTLDQKTDGTATLQIGNVDLKTAPRQNSYDVVLSMAMAMRDMLVELHVVPVAGDRFTARVLSLPYMASTSPTDKKAA
jgi:hypothetical protein